MGLAEWLESPSPSFLIWGVFILRQYDKNRVLQFASLSAKGRFGERKSDQGSMLSSSFLQKRGRKFYNKELLMGGCLSPLPKNFIPDTWKRCARPGSCTNGKSLCIGKYRILKGIGVWTKTTAKYFSKQRMLKLSSHQPLPPPLSEDKPAAQPVQPLTMVDYEGTQNNKG